MLEFVKKLNTTKEELSDFYLVLYCSAGHACLIMRDCFKLPAEKDLKLLAFISHEGDEFSNMHAFKHFYHKGKYHEKFSISLLICVH